MFIESSKKPQVDCYVDSNFAGLFVEIDQDPTCAKSRSGYMIELMGCQLTWVRKLQMQVDLSTIDLEFIPLSHSMRDLIVIRGVIREISNVVFMGKLEKPNIVTWTQIFIKISKSIFTRITMYISSFLPCQKCLRALSTLLYQLVSLDQKRSV